MCIYVHMKGLGSSSSLARSIAEDPRTFCAVALLGSGFVEEPGHDAELQGHVSEVVSQLPHHSNISLRALRETDLETDRGRMFFTQLHDAVGITAGSRGTWELLASSSSWWYDSRAGKTCCTETGNACWELFCLEARPSARWTAACGAPCSVRPVLVYMGPAVC